MGGVCCLSKILGIIIDNIVDNIPNIPDIRDVIITEGSIFFILLSYMK